MPESMEQTIEILIVDDHTLFREGVARLLETEVAFKVVGCGSKRSQFYGNGRSI